MARNWNKWDPTDYDRLEALLADGLTYSQAGEALGRTFNQVRGATERLGLRDPERKRSVHDYTTLDPIIRDCIEAELMCVPQIVERLRSLGHPLSRYAVHKRVKKMPYHVRQRLARNAMTRRANRARLYHMRRTAQKRRAA